MTIDTVHKRMMGLVPEARFAVAHGQMPSGELSDVMHEFVHGETDVLLCTTIVESGLDVPNANTIIIDRADRFGLADLYQLRGRVGRSSRKAYAILLIPGQGRVDSVARKRINAVRQHSQPGAGFRLALRDLEIRGAGNLLGAQQSGHIAAVGFALYCQLLQRTVRSLKGEDLPPLIDVRLDLDFVQLSPDTEEENSIAIPFSYVEEERLRLDVYRSIASLSRLPEIDALREELKDRFGPPPAPVEGLLLLARVRIAAHEKRLVGIETRSGKVMCRGYKGYVKESAKFPRLHGDTVNEQLASLLEIVRDLPACPA
jgi:transcription-repair coupling factor (superfamily II helicase)